MLGLQPPGPLRSRVNVQSPITTTRGVLLASARHVALADVQRLASVVVERIGTVAFTAVLHTGDAESFFGAEVEALSDGEALAGHGAGVESTVTAVGGTTSGLPSDGDTRRSGDRWSGSVSGSSRGTCTGDWGNRDENVGSLSGCRACNKSGDGVGR